MKNNNLKFRIALIQMSMDELPGANIKKAKDFIKKAVKEKPDVICLPELFSSRYFCQTEEHFYFMLAETVPGPLSKDFCSFAKSVKTNIIVPVFEKEMKGIYYNSLFVADKYGNFAGKYRKTHIPDDPSYYEKFYFRPGNSGYKVFDLQGLKAGTLICWDQWFTEGARCTTLMGADIIFYPTAIGYHPHEKEKYGPTQLDSWITVQRGHAITNGVYLAACNRVGFEKHPTENSGIEFWGNSFICNPQGKILAKAGSDEEILFAEIDLNHLEIVRQHWPFLRDRRPNTYSKIIEE